MTDMTLARASAHTLHRMLQDLASQPEHGEGSPVAFAADLVDQVCGYLDDEADDDERPRLRLVSRR